MRIFRHYQDLPTEARGCSVAIGNFDGVHRGHQAVIHEAGVSSKDLGGPWTVMTFEPHPRMFFKPDQPPFRLTPMRVKAQQVEALGADYMVVLHFDKALSSLSADTFIKEVLVDALGAQHVIAGYDFQFGHDRKGNAELLLAKGREYGYHFTVVRPVTDDDGQPFSSTRVRDCLRSGDPKGAAFVLGRDFEIEGRVEKGDQRGQTIGFPTANLRLGEYMEPTHGVYAIRAGLEIDGHFQWYDGVANLGVRPTVNDRGVLLEVNLFNFDQDIYGQHMRVALADFIRPEKKFDGLDDLKTQIAEDADRAKLILAGHSRII
ncbi:MAG: bifunctional riboflavin kinase/FAD synthetase [Rhodospirillales bacterium]|nr:bifunctional riboflavin kinase/FAD synthetase [Rhodospirillales bacterium]